MNSRDPFVKLMVIGKVNDKIYQMISKPTLSEIDVKLLKGIYFKNTIKKNPKKGLFDTFCPEETQGAKLKVIRRLNSFMIVDHIEEERVKKF